MTLKTFALSAVLAVGLASCNSSKTVLPYFVDISDVKEGHLPLSDFMPVIEPDDELYISVTSVSPEATAV